MLLRGLGNVDRVPRPCYDPTINIEGGAAMAYQLAPALCAAELGGTARMPFVLQLDFQDETLVGYAAITEPCARHSGHVMVSGWLVVSTRTLSYLDNDGVCYRQRVLHNFEAEGEG